MLKECRAHGYFRAENCPSCGDAGKFLMNEEELDRLGRIMAGVLRHFPERFGLKMDEHGWVDLRGFVESVRVKRNQFHWLRPHHIRAIVDTDPKGRYQIDGERIRATYGHSLELDLDLPTDDIPDYLYYPATEEEVEIILETGLKPSDRKQVHLSRTAEDAKNAGSQRVEAPIILEINAKKAIEGGTVIKRAGKTVFVTHEVPSQFLERYKGKTEEEL